MCFQVDDPALVGPDTEGPLSLLYLHIEPELPIFDDLRELAVHRAAGALGSATHVLDADLESHGALGLGQVLAGEDRRVALHHRDHPGRREHGCPESPADVGHQSPLHGELVAARQAGLERHRAHPSGPENAISFPGSRMPKPTHSAEVIVVGAGSAGAAAARRLFDRGATVLLLEAGGPADNPAIDDVGRAHELWHTPEDWAFFTVPQQHAARRSLHWPRGKVVGGSSCLNAAIYVRGAAADFDHWAYLGCPGWRWEDVRPVYERMEDPGPLSVLTDYELAPLHRSIIEAAAEAGIPVNENYNGGELDGVSQMHLTIKDGRRQSTGVAYLEPIAGLEGFTLVTSAHVRRLILENGRCRGVEWHSAGGLCRAEAEVEVIVAAGTIQSPQVLMLSGIGPADHLREVGVEPLVDLRGVGLNLHDHLLSPVIFGAERPIGPPSPGATPAH